jgi:hypothetical protein
MKNTKDLNYYKNNCEEDYIKTPISVLRYITELEQALQLLQTAVIVRSEQFYCDNKERKYKDSVCTEQCDMCEYTANHK